MIKYAKTECVEPLPTSAVNIIRGEEPTGSGLTRYLANTPIGDIDLFFNGQRLTRNIDYALSEKQIQLSQELIGILRATYNF